MSCIENIWKSITTTDRKTVFFRLFHFIIILARHSVQDCGHHRVSFIVTTTHSKWFSFSGFFSKIWLNHILIRRRRRIWILGNEIILLAKTYRGGSGGNHGRHIIDAVTGVRGMLLEGFMIGDSRAFEEWVTGFRFRVVKLWFINLGTRTVFNHILPIIMIF